MASSPVAGKYERAVDNESAYEVLQKRNAEEAERQELRRQREELEAEKEKLRKDKEKADAAAAKKKEKDAERKAAKKERAAERRRSKIETQLISAGGRILKRGLLGILKFK